jgi:hypothetical protein
MDDARRLSSFVRRHMPERFYDRRTEGLPRRNFPGVIIILVEQPFRPALAHRYTICYSSLCPVYRPMRRRVCYFVYRLFSF